MSAQQVLAGSMSEAQLLAHVRDAAAKLGWLCYHTHRSDRSEAGFPDLVLVRGAVCLFAELKREGKNLDKAQFPWMHALLAAGQRYYLWRPSDWLSGNIDRVLIITEASS